MRLVALISMAFLSAPIAAQTERKVPVEVHYSGKDELGNRYAAELREAIRASEALKLGDPTGIAILGAYITSVELEASQVAVSTTITYDEAGLPFKYLLGGSVQVCGRNRLQACARTDLADIDKAVHSLKSENPDMWAKLK